MEYRKRLAALLLCTLIALAVFTQIRPVTVAEVSGIPAAGVRNQTVRVHLTRLGLSDRVDLTLTCAYGVELDGGQQLYLPAGSEVAIMLRDGGICLYYRGMSMTLGSSVMLRRYDQEETGGGFYRTNYPAFYEGDLALDIVEGRLRPVLHIHVEDYLLGVVPYEMGEGFPLEALKAQAVAARTYALRKQSADGAYDVVDTTNDQVYKGYLPGNDLVEQAVSETQGICGFYKGKLAQCYYSASNGGQMELVETVWPTGEDFGYYAFGRDPYDVANPLSTVRSFEIAKAYGAEEHAPVELRRMLAKQLHQQLVQKGLDTDPDSLRVERVTAVSVDGPTQPDSLWMTTLHMTVELSGRTRREAPVRYNDPYGEEVSLFADTVTAAPATFAPITTLQPTATPQPVYGPWQSLGQPVTLTLDIFPTVEAALAMSISSNYENEIWSVRETQDAFVLEARRYGHGVGMSQRGAQWMAGTMEKTYTDILSFYYPGLELKRFETAEPALPTVQPALAETPGPAPSATPRPTLMPVTLQAQEGQWYAAVTEIDDNSSLNLRSAPNLNGTILMRLYKGQRLLVVERCAEEGWVKVRTDAAEGYVVESYLTNE